MIKKEESNAEYVEIAEKINSLLNDLLGKYKIESCLLALLGSVLWLCSKHPDKKEFFNSVLEVLKRMWEDMEEHEINEKEKL